MDLVATISENVLLQFDPVQGMKNIAAYTSDNIAGGSPVDVNIIALLSLPLNENNELVFYFTGIYELPDYLNNV